MTASSSPGFGGLGEAMPRVSGITTIIGLAFLAAMRLSRMNWAWPPWRGSVLVHFESSSPPPWFR